MYVWLEDAYTYIRCHVATSYGPHKPQSKTRQIQLAGAPPPPFNTYTKLFSRPLHFLRIHTNILHTYLWAAVWQ